MAIEVIKPGLATTFRMRPARLLQYRHPLSGALDQYALARGEPAGRQRGGRCRTGGELAGAGAGFRAPAIIAVTGAEATPKINGEARPRNEFFRGQGGRSAHVRFHEGLARELYRGRRRYRCPGRPRQPLDLRAGRARRVFRPQSCGGRRAARWSARGQERAPDVLSRAILRRPIPSRLSCAC